MVTRDDVHAMIHDLASVTGTTEFTWSMVSRFAREFAERHRGDNPQLQVFLAENRDLHLRECLEGLERTAVVELEREPGEKRFGQERRSRAITGVRYCRYFPCELDRLYREMEKGERRGFPRHANLSVPPPQDLVQSLLLTEGIAGVLDDEGIPADTVLKVEFKGRIPAVLVTKRILRDRIPNLAFTILRTVILRDWSVARLERMLQTVFPDQGDEIRSTLQVFLADSTEAEPFLRETTSFQRELLVKLCSAVVQEERHKHITDDADWAVSQAAYLLAASIVYQGRKNRQQRGAQDARRLITWELRKPPYVYSIKEIESLRDSQGRTLAELLPQEKIRAVLDEMTGTGNGDDPPELVTVEIPARGIRYIHTAEYIPLLLRNVEEARRTVRAAMLEEFVRLLRHNNRQSWMTDNIALEEYLETYLRREHPLLYSMARYKLLSPILVEHGTDEGANEATELLDSANLRMHRWSRILEIDRAELYHEALQQLPLWSRIPLVREMGAFFTRDNGTK